MKHIAILAYPGCSGAQVLGLHDSMLLANRVSVTVMGQQPLFDVRVVGVSGRSAMGAGGVRIGLAKPHRRPDLLIVPGFALEEDTSDETLAGLDPQVKLIANTFRRGVPVAAVCVGAFLLGQAGMLDGRRATTAWMYSPELARRYPAATVEPEAILVEDGGITTTGGFSVAYDLAIHLLRKMGGNGLAEAFGKFAMLDTHRTSQAPFADAALLDQSFGAFSGAIKHWLEERLSEPYMLDRLARAFSVSARTLQRKFQAEAGVSPLVYLQHARIEAAKQLLTSTTLGVAAITERVGYQNVSTFARFFHREVGCAPGRYREQARSRPGTARSMSA